MTERKTPWLAAVAAALLPAAAMAQGASAPPPRPDPADAKALVPALQHRSAIADYRRLDGPAPPVPWREANDRVERIGGWRAYAREAQAPAPSASAPPVR
jgi:hypothetical protein